MARGKQVVELIRTRWPILPRKSVWSLLMLACVLPALPVTAGDSHTKRAVVSVGEEATRAFEDGDFARAAELYLNAWQLAPESKYLYGAARCAHMAGHHEQAMAGYRRFLAAKGADERRVANVKRYMEEITADKVATLMHDANRAARDSPELAAQIYLEGFALAPNRFDLLFKAAVAEHLSGELVLARTHLRQYLAAADATAADHSHAIARLRLLDRKLDGIVGTPDDALSVSAPVTRTAAEGGTICPLGMQPDGKRCVPVSGCPDGMTWNGRACVVAATTCLGENGKTCRETGSAYYHGRGVLISYPTAAQWFRKACDAGDPIGCTSLGIAYVNGRGVEKDSAVAAALYSQACAAGYAPACYNLGVRYERALGVPQDLARAAGLYQVACEEADARGCYNLGVFYYKGQGVTQHLSRAAELFQRACDGDDSIGCYNLGVVNMRGDGVPQDMALAAKWFQRACDSDDAGACFWLGKLYRNGQGVQHDAGRTVELERHACERGNAAGCRLVGDLFAAGEGVSKDFAKANQFYSQSCELGDMNGCTELGQLLCTHRVVPQDAPIGLALLTKACGRGFKRACELAATDACKEAPPTP